MADYYNTGTVSVAADGITVTGAGTFWEPIIRDGDTMEVAGQRVTVGVVVGNTALVLASPVAGAPISGAAYAIRFDAPARFKNVTLLAQVRSMLDQIGIFEKARPNYEVQSLGANAPPGAPVTGDLYVVGTAPTGAWAGQANNLAQWTGSAWLFTAPQRGATVVSAANSKTYIWSGAGWGVYVAPSPFIETLMDDADAPAARTTLGAQAADATLTALAGLATAAGIVPRFTGADTLEGMTVHDFAKSFLDDGSGNAVCNTIGAARLNQFTSVNPNSEIASYLFPGGTLFQRGTQVVTPNAGDGLFAITFPTAFLSGSSYNLVAWNGDNGVGQYTIDHFRNASFPGPTSTLARAKNMAGTVITSALRVDWLAFGR